MAEARNTVTITDNRTGKQIDLPIRYGSEGPGAVEIGAFTKEFGLFTLDPGFMSTASCDSKITYIDGDKGVLLYRGYPIEQLAEHSSYLEVCYLLLNGELPNEEQLREFVWTIHHHTMLHEQIQRFFMGFRRDAHPMAIMVGCVGALSAFYHDHLDINDSHDRMITAHRIVAKMPTLAAACYKYSVGQPFVYPDNKLGYTENFLKMMFSVPCEDYEISAVQARALDIIFTLHADHEQNASASTVRLAGSSQANPYACISAGIGALWGPAHGGANEAVLRMLAEIGDPNRIPHYIERAKSKTDPFRLMGFGHRIYKNFDPRAKVIRKMCHEVLSQLKTQDPLFEIALKLEDVALHDSYFIEKKLYPNVDFYSGIILKAIGIPVNMFTVIFALARAVGWISQWTEMITDPAQKIGRPRQLYVGHPTRDYVPIENRG